MNRPKRILCSEVTKCKAKRKWRKLFNLLRGEMARQIPSFEQRHLVRPGMTGWAQVQCKYTTSVAEYRKKVQYDLYYIKNMAFALDFKILLKTIWVVLTAKGAR